MTNSVVSFFLSINLYLKYFLFIALITNKKIWLWANNIITTEYYCKNSIIDLSRLKNFDCIHIYHKIMW